MKRAVLLLLSGTFASFATKVLACGFHDASGAGMLNLIYPRSLYVRTAVWEAQQGGLLGKIECIPQVPNADEAKLLALLRLRKVTAKLEEFGSRLPAPAAGEAARPPFAMVLLGPMLWTRFEIAGNALSTKVHAAGPAAGDVVAVTDEAVILGLLEGRISPQKVRELELIRFYGDPEKVRAATAWLDQFSPSNDNRREQR